MKRLPDISEYFIGQRAVDEEIAWIMTRNHHRKLAVVLPRIPSYKVRSIIEWGCRSGLIASGLPESIDYIGVEQNEEWLEKAKERNLAERCFMLGNIRDGIRLSEYRDDIDLSMGFDFMKHFALEEWDAILGKLLTSGKYGCFSLQLLDKDLNNGVDFNHVYVTEQHLQAALQAAGHKEVERVVLWEGHLNDHGPMKDVAVWTETINEERT